MKRRSLLKIALIAGAVSSVASVHAAGYPDRALRLIVPWPAGGVTDVVGRLLADKLSKELGQPIVVENRPGANGFIGTDLAAKAKPDGYTLLLVTMTTHVIAPNMYRKVPYDSVKDFAPISQITAAPTIMVAPVSSRFHDVGELISYAKANPEKLNYATYGQGGSSQLAAQLFMQAAGIRMTAIPYQGATPAVMGLMGGDVDVFFDSIPSSLPHVLAGKLKAFAVTSLERVDAAPDVPTMAEYFPGFEFMVWQGVEAPAGTAKPVIDRLHDAVAKVIADPDMKKRISGLGAFAVTSESPKQFEQHIVDEKRRWADVIERAGIPKIEN
ncbi:tripartite tricarboxylate transporter substrate binding protein [Bordetella petrii]|nr:tripartite tricarboxylate transporter substrate binding protein [Bordetella petrii]